ncbi:MAG: YhcH/YjgK/YiaL family protein [Ignavibacteria bacterium]|nr:YhcH/YjgK/YiaL family protein [Ignavibacteria bacterium]
MIADSLHNIDIYKKISNDIYEGLLFLRNVKPEIEIGEYKVNQNVKALVSQYETVAVFERGYEAHKNVIDIQYPIIGLEKIKWCPLTGMTMHIDYDPLKDRAFYKNPTQESHVIIGNNIFGIFFPEDAHGPQHFVYGPELIKKITIKVKIS